MTMGVSISPPQIDGYLSPQAGGEGRLVQSASGSGFGPEFCGSVPNRASITSLAVSFLSLSYMFGFGRLAAAAVSCLSFLVSRLVLGLLADAVVSHL